ncbi:NAD(P)-binding protein [Sporormia fimetaria CBS 119925]|uniref:NAD(P)-binding protein n=1 Tax=Sporormia fimetaria CBS 119925 TaxID=1340428 RepID=A0A6A6V8G6_9PLEO|nr:NAD(P)-binding protein [Sporormia fimetaria CBS 119925]
METPRAILITGATGKQGGAVLKHLAQHPRASEFTLLAVTRNPASPSAQKLRDSYPNTHLVQGDLNDVKRLFINAKEVLHENKLPNSIWGVYSVQVSMGSGVTFDGEVRQGKDLIDESLAEGVKHFVYSSVDRGGNEKSFDNETPIPHFQTKHRIEQYLVEKAGKGGENMHWTILRPVAFMDNLETSFKTKVFLTALHNTLKDKPLQWISVDDIGLFAAKAFRESLSWNAKAEGLAGDELTFQELSGCFERVTGRPAPTTVGPMGSILMLMVKELRVMINWFKTDGYGVDIGRLRGMDGDLCDFETWLRERSPWAEQGKGKM